MRRTTLVLVRVKAVLFLGVLALAVPHLAQTTLLVVPLAVLLVVPHLAQITRLGRLFDNSDSSFIWLYIWVI